VNFNAFIALSKYFVEPLATAEHGILAQQQFGFESSFGIDQGTADIATADVFVEGIGGLVDDQLIEFHGLNLMFFAA
jgi:hypothetical protein